MKPPKKGEKLDILKANDICKLGICDAYSSILYHQKLIDKWKDPKDIAQRAATIIRDIHKMHGRTLFSVLKQLQNNCKHPKKMHDICNGVKYCMNCNMDLEKVVAKNKISKKRITKHL